MHADRLTSPDKSLQNAQGPYKHEKYDNPDPLSAHLLLPVRVRVIDRHLSDDVARWYPGFPSNASPMSLAA
jgi:hypothetical protein